MVTVSEKIVKTQNDIDITQIKMFTTVNKALFKTSLCPGLPVFEFYCGCFFCMWS